MIPGARLVIFGRQGAGKGTQCVRLSRHYVVPHISTGDTLRAAVREGTELGKTAKAIMDSGGLVSDDIMIGIVEERLGRDDAMTRGFILDGFPRTVGQAKALNGIVDTQGKPIDVAIDLNVPRELVLERILARRVCRDCGTNYTSTGNDPSPWICDVCGGDVVQRRRHPEAVNQRLDLYESQTAALKDFYGEMGILAVRSSRPSRRRASAPGRGDRPPASALVRRHAPGSGARRRSSLRCGEAGRVVPRCTNRSGPNSARASRPAGSTRSPATSWLGGERRRTSWGTTATPR
ncbi:MAG: nucleoside monophosphate kinase [Ilumatobacteraceae bacterium]